MQEQIEPSYMSNLIIFIAGFAGAVIGHFLSKNIDRMFNIGEEFESNKNAELLEFIETINNLKTASEEYWSSEPSELKKREFQLKADINAELLHLSLINNQLFCERIEFIKATQKQIMELIDKTSGGNFGDPDQKASPDRIADIAKITLTAKHWAKVRRRKLKRHIFG